MSPKILAAAIAGLTSAVLSGPAAACGGYTYIGQICAFGGNFCPIYTVEANGQLLSVAQNQALYALIGNTYGGDGVNNFAVPDLRGRTPVGTGQGTGLANVTPGARGGTESVTVSQNQLPAHNHVIAFTTKATAAGATPGPDKKGTPTQDILQNVDATVSPAGGSQPVAIRNPYLGMRFCIVVEGIWPSRD